MKALVPILLLVLCVACESSPSTELMDEADVSGASDAGSVPSDAARCTGDFCQIDSLSGTVGEAEWNEACRANCDVRLGCCPHLEDSESACDASYYNYETVEICTANCMEAERDGCPIDVLAFLVCIGGLSCEELAGHERAREQCDPSCIEGVYRCAGSSEPYPCSAETMHVYTCAYGSDCQ